MDPMLLTQDPESEMQRANQLRLAAHRAMMETDTREAIAKAARAGPRPRARVEVGDWVRVWRKFNRDSADAWTHDFVKARWVGPCMVLCVHSGSVWVGHKGQLWKCSLEQARLATSDECRGAELMSVRTTTSSGGQLSRPRAGSTRSRM